MTTVTIEALSSLVHDYIAAQAKRDAERDKRDAERDAERDKRDAERDAERDKRDAIWLAQIARIEADRAESEAKSRAQSEQEWKKLRQELGGLGISYGEQVEAMFVKLGAKFNELDYNFPKEARSMKFHDENRRVLAEVDHLLENGNVIMPVEVKAKLKIDDVDDHIRRLGIISKFNANHNDSRKVLGAVAGGVVPQNVLEYAQRKGLFVLVQNGDSVEIADLPSCFVPREW